MILAHQDGGGVVEDMNQHGWKNRTGPNRQRSEHDAENRSRSNSEDTHVKQPEERAHKKALHDRL